MMDSNANSKGHPRPHGGGTRAASWLLRATPSTSSTSTWFTNIISRRDRKLVLGLLICCIFFFFSIFALPTTTFGLCWATGGAGGGEKELSSSLTPPAVPAVTEQSRSGKTKTFRGSQYWKDGVTQSVQTVWESEFARFQVHSIQLNAANGNGGNTIIDDWLWYDESDNVNVLVQEQHDGGGNGGDFIVLEQTKYAIPGTSLAVMGGLIEQDETPLQAAERELQEELGMSTSHWKSLGNFVAAANRGGGTTHVFWARNETTTTSTTSSTVRGSSPSSKETNKKDSVNMIAAKGELERQDVVRLSRSQLVEALLLGKFREIKWTATVALALLQEHEERRIL
jgi:ADP-ribose pyrophosphatase